MDAQLDGRDENRLMISVRGEIDLANADELFQRLIVLAQPTSCQIALDLSEVTFMDCAGLHMLSALDRHVRARGGAMFVAATSATVARLFELAGSFTAQLLYPAYPVPGIPRPVASPP